VTGPGAPQRAPRAREARRATALAGLVALQAVCAAFFLGDVAGDLGWPARWGEADAHTAFEAAVSLSLVAGVVFGALALRDALARLGRAEAALSAASGAFHQLLEARFDLWRLTPAERDVALLTVKGLGPAEIAALRGSAEGTVRAQAARVYAKAGVSGRAQLLALFVEELMAAPLAAREAASG
jgi:DNA-binding CsgD family transcriptional regulator